jgi:hypothetical protein
MTACVIVSSRELQSRDHRQVKLLVLLQRRLSGAAGSIAHYFRLRLESRNMKH